jgi:hypothetical protein
VKPDAALKLLSEVRDLTIVDSENKRCGICDDIEFSGGPGAELRVVALLVGPGAYQRRLPRWLYQLIALLCGTRCVRVPWAAVDRVSGEIHLTKTGAALGLRQTEEALSRRFAKVPFS